MAELSPGERARFDGRQVRCPLVESRIESLSDYFSVFGQFFETEGPFWFRGHADLSWQLSPSALRFDSEPVRARALSLLSDFRRVAEIKQARPPADNDLLGWVQVAQHYGLPTRLLDWTESPMVALYFACEQTDRDGLVFVVNPIAMNRLTFPSRPRILNPRTDQSLISRFLQLGPRRSGRGFSAKTVAVNPIWNSERIVIQKGVFTLHGSAALPADTPSLAAVPIPSAVKAKLRRELEWVGVDEMSLFPELEHACRHLRKRAQLEG